MNVYALAGFQVVFNGNPNTPDHERAKKHLKIGNVYTVYRTDVWRLSTEVYLMEVPGGISFDPGNFYDLKPQNTEDDAKHPDWATHHQF